MNAVTDELLLVDRDPPLATVTLNRPEKRNALSDALRRELAAAMAALGTDDAVSVVILTGAGPVFCAGFDRSEFAPSTDVFADESRWLSGQLMHEALQSFGKPLVGAINGPALGGGFDIATQCDVRIASDDAGFGHPEIKFGAPTLYTVLSQVVGGAVARDLCLSGRRIDSAEALRLGLVTMVVPRDRLMDEARAYARMVAEAPLNALKAVKAAIVNSTPFTVT